MILQVDPSISIRMNRSSDASITKVLCRSVGSLHILSYTFGIGFCLSVIFPLCFQTINFSQNPGLSPLLNQV